MRKLFTLILTIFSLVQITVLGADIGQWSIFETSFKTAKSYTNAFTDVDVDVVFSLGEKQWKVPAFWAGGDTWKVRFAPPALGKYTYRVECSDKDNAGLNGKEKTLSVAAYKGDNPLLKHGFLRVAEDKRHFEHADGTPFLWLGDTWWKGLCKRMTWEGFQELTADRKAKGFNVVQIVCGPYPDEKTMEPRWGNEGGLPYEKIDFSEMNPRYFDFADRRIRHLVENGIVPAIVGGWGRPQGGGTPTIIQVGLDGYKRHWRNLIARYGAYPAVWIVGGEASDKNGPWADLTKYVHEVDPYRHLLVYHAPGDPRSEIKSNNELFDFDMVAIAHDNFVGAKQTLDLINATLSKIPYKPIICGEACYEGHMQNNFQDVQRHMFWSYMLSGAAGHTYGAAGIWHAGVEGDAGHTGISGKEYDFTTWKEGMVLPGAIQVGLGKKLLEQYLWKRFESHPEWVEEGSFAAGIPGEVRFIYLPRRNVYNWNGPTVKNLEANIDWHIYYFDPATGRKFDQGILKAQVKSGDNLAKPVEFKKDVPSPQDWVMVFEKSRKNNE